MSDLHTLLPPNTTGPMRALETVMAERTAGIDAPIATLWNAETCPVALLPWLAWAFSVEVWEHAWPEAIKRNVIRNAVQVHRLKGTRRSVELALEALEMRIDLREGFELDGQGNPLGPPHTFTLDAFAHDVFDAEFQVDASLYALVDTLIRNVKPVRSRYTLRIGERYQTEAMSRTAVRVSGLAADATEPAPRSRLSRTTTYSRALTATARIATADLIAAPRTRLANCLVATRQRVRASLLMRHSSTVEHRSA